MAKRLYAGFEQLGTFGLIDGGSWKELPKIDVGASHRTSFHFTRAD